MAGTWSAERTVLAAETIPTKKAGYVHSVSSCSCPPHLPQKLPYLGPHRSSQSCRMQGPARCILSIGPRVFGAMQAGQGLLEQQLGSSVVRSASGVITQGPAPSSSSTSERNTGKAGFRAAGFSGHRHFHASTGEAVLGQCGIASFCESQGVAQLHPMYSALVYVV